MLELPEERSVITDQEYRDFRQKFQELQKRYKSLASKVARLQSGDTSIKLAGLGAENQQLKVEIKQAREEADKAKATLQELHVELEALRSELDVKTGELLNKTFGEEGPAKWSLKLAKERLKAIRVLADKNLQNHDKIARGLAEVWPNLLAKETQSFTTSALEEPLQTSSSRESTPVVSFDDPN